MNGRVTDMTNKRNEFELGNKEIRKLLSEISAFDDEIQPASLQEVGEIEASYQASQVVAGDETLQNEFLAELRKDIGEDVNPPSSIIGYAQSRGIDRRDLANRLRISTDILMKLERRLLKWIPDQLVGQIAEVLQIKKAEIYIYLQQDPEQINLAANSKRTPTANRTQLWEEAVKTSQMNEEDKQYWIKQV